jgi:hypothetical protein
LFQIINMAYAAIEEAHMVPVRGDWARRSVAGLSRGPYSVETLGRMEYENMDIFVYFGNEYLAGS